MHHLQRSGAVSSDIGVWIGNIELRDDDADGDEIIVAAIFSYRSRISRRRLATSCGSMHAEIKHTTLA